MRRRKLITLVVGGAAALPLLARAQDVTAKRWIIGSVLVGTPEAVTPLGAAIEKELGHLGYQNGQNIELITKIAKPRPEIVEGTIAALLPKIDVLVVGGTIGGIAAKKIAREVPTVFHSVGAPVDIGLVQSLPHPGGNMTGITFEAATETYAKRLQVLKEIAPQIVRVAVLQARSDGMAKFAMSSLERSAPELNVELSPFDVRSADDIDAAFSDMQRRRMEAVIVVAGALTYSNTKKVADLALAARLPSCHPFREAVLAGGLVSLGPDLVEIAGKLS